MSTTTRRVTRSDLRTAFNHAHNHMDALGIVAPVSASTNPETPAVLVLRDPSISGGPYALVWLDPATGDSHGAIRDGGYLGDTAREALRSLVNLSEAFALVRSEESSQHRR